MKAWVALSLALLAPSLHAGALETNVPVRGTAVSLVPLRISLGSGASMLPAGTRFEVLENAPDRVLLLHRAGQLSASPGQVKITTALPASSPAAADGENKTNSPRVVSAIERNREPEATPGSVGEGKIPATWDRPRFFDVSFLDDTTGVLRVGDGPRGVVLLVHPDSFTARGMLRAGAKEYREETMGEVSLFFPSYPEFFERRFVPKFLERYLAGDHALRSQTAGAVSRLVAQIREITGISELLLVGNSLGAGLILADYEELSRDERNSFLLISPMEVFMGPDQQLGPLARTTLLCNEETDPFVQGASVRRWLAQNKNQKVAEAIDAARDKSDPLGVSLLKGHLTLGDQLSSAMLARLIRFCKGGSLEELRRPLPANSFEFQGRRVIMETNGSAPKKLVMFDTESPFQRLRYRFMRPSSGQEWNASMVAWDFAEPDERGYFVPGVAAEIVGHLRRQGAGQIALYGIGAGASLLLHDYAELSKLPGVSLILLSPRQHLMPPPPWPELDRNFAFLIANEKTDPNVRSEEFRSWLAGNKHPVSGAINHTFAQYVPQLSGLAGVPVSRGRNPLVDLPEAPEVYGDFSAHIRAAHLYKPSDYALGLFGIRGFLPSYLVVGDKDRERAFGKK